METASCSSDKRVVSTDNESHGLPRCQLRIQIDTHHGFKHICEIQYHHKELKKLGKELGFHQSYEYFRSYFAGATGSLEDRLGDLELMSPRRSYGCFVSRRALVEKYGRRAS
jgi:hypothetical protein